MPNPKGHTTAERLTSGQTGSRPWVPPAEESVRVGQTASPLVFYWENFGPTHVDRCEAVAARFPDREVIGIELSSRSATYDWEPESGTHFRKITLYRAGTPLGWARTALGLLSVCLRSGTRHVFVCHYEQLGTQVASFVLRLLGRRVYMMLDSKFDDYPRILWREFIKSFWIMHYSGAMAGSLRTRQYLTFLGMKRDRIVGSYDTISIARIRALAEAPPAPEGVPFAERHFTVIARLVPKKNLFTLIDGFALYAVAALAPRPLRIFGNGPLEAPLREHAARRGVDHLVSFEGFRQTRDICRALATTLALIHISTEEQFGLAIIEALALGVPVIVSLNCGARDDFVRTFVNGFLVEVDNPEGLAFFLGFLSGDKDLWADLAKGTAAFAEKADVTNFARSIEQLTASPR